MNDIAKAWSRVSGRHNLMVALLTGGGDRPYMFGLTSELMAKGISLDIIGSDDLDSPNFHDAPGVRFLNLRGGQQSNVEFLEKVLRVLRYYVRLILYAATAKPEIFHILWNNKFQLFDRTILMAYYKLLGKKIILTLHNVNANKRDSKDSFINRLTLRIQYRLADHLFVHTEQMRSELFQEFGVRASRVTVIPFGINNSVPNTELTPAEAKRRLGLNDKEHTILFFGNIAPYKGLEFLVAAFRQILTRCDSYRLIISGWPKYCDEYWTGIRNSMHAEVQSGKVLLRDEYIPDNETELFFKGADVLVLPYKYIYQSGVLFLGYSFGLPVLAADVGSLKDEIVEGKTGFIFRPQDSVDLAAAIERYFASELFANLSGRRQEIKDFANKRYSWDVVGEITTRVYSDLT